MASGGMCYICNKILKKYAPNTDTLAYLDHELLICGECLKKIEEYNKNNMNLEQPLNVDKIIDLVDVKLDLFAEHFKGLSENN